MKISIECKDIILEQALRLFLKDYLVLQKDCDFLVCDSYLNLAKPQFIIHKFSPQLQIPFSKEQLLKALNDFNTALLELAQKKALEQKQALEAKIEHIANEFKKAYEQELSRAINDLKAQFINALNEKK